MSGYQGKKNIPRITVSFVLFYHICPAVEVYKGYGELHSLDQKLASAYHPFTLTLSTAAAAAAQLHIPTAWDGNQLVCKPFNNSSFEIWVLQFFLCNEYSDQVI